MDATAPASKMESFWAVFDFIHLIFPYVALMAGLLFTCTIPYIHG